MMPKICYTPKSFTSDSRSRIETANAILEEYAAQGYDLTVRQLYYQFVSRALIANKQNEYDNLGALVSAARLAGLIDWDHIVDRTRNLRSNAHWESAANMAADVAEQFALDKWASQRDYLEVWIEKDALIGVLDVACEPLDVSYFSCRGYTSQSEMWNAAIRRLLEHHEAGQNLHIIHLADHDPSGIDMTRDIEDRLNLFLRHHGSTDVEINRIALNMDQVREFNPPPNPAKLSDSRSREYIRRYGNESWELDALEPAVLTALIGAAVMEYRDETRWELSLSREEAARETLRDAAAWIRRQAE